MNESNLNFPEVSVIMPCLNEEEGIGKCIEKIKKTFELNNISGEIIVVDNGSTDQSAEIAKNLGARVEFEPIKGYGSAYIKGFSVAKGKYFIMGDADDTYDFHLIPKFLEKLKKENFDFVTGSRYMTKDGKKEIPFMHRVFGNPALTLILNILFNTKYSDVYCGFRGFTKSSYQSISPISTGMEFNLELAINARLKNLKIAEIPIVLSPRKGESKLRTVRDGWRSLRMMLLYCPNKVFIIPGVSLLLLGICLHLIVLFSIINLSGRSLGVVTSIFATVFCIVGLQILSLGLHAKTYSWSRRFDKSNYIIEKFYKKFSLEKGLILSAFLLISGFVSSIAILINWVKSNFVSLSHPEFASLSALLIIFGFHILFTSLFISSMSLTNKRDI